MPDQHDPINNPPHPAATPLSAAPITPADPPLRTALYLLPVILMVIVAAFQMVRVKALELGSPDRGGGFGMFATVDKSNNRVIRIVLTSEDGRTVAVPVTPQRDLPLNDIYRVVGDPTETRLRAAAQTIAHQYQADQSTPPLASVTVEVFSILYDVYQDQSGQAALIERVPLNQYTLELAK